MAKVTLTYLDFSGSRGEECRLALHLAGVEFHDERLPRAEVIARKPEWPFGSVPVFTVEGHAPLAQSNPILRLIGTQHGLHPKDPWAAAYEEALMEAVEDLRHHTQPIVRIPDETEKKRAREELASGYLQDWAAHVERQLMALSAGPFVSGASPHVVDLKIFVVLGPYLKGNIDYVSADVFKRFPRLLGVYEAVKVHPKIVEWYAKR